MKTDLDYQREIRVLKKQLGEYDSMLRQLSDEVVRIQRSAREYEAAFEEAYIFVSRFDSIINQIEDFVTGGDEKGVEKRLREAKMLYRMMHRAKTSYRDIKEFGVERYTDESPGSNPGSGGEQGDTEEEHT